MKPSALILFFSIPIVTLCQQFNQDFEAANIKYFVIANIVGDISVKGGQTDQISVRTIQEYRNKKENDKPHVAYLISGDTLALYISSACTQFSLNCPGQKGQTRWGYYDWDKCQDHDHTQLSVDFEVTLPEHMHTILSTINDGDIVAERLTAQVWANNVNGAIAIKNVVDVGAARTINGNVDLLFDRVPISPGVFYTLNGNINAQFPEDLNADVSFKTFQGDFYTNFQNTKNHPINIEKKTKDNGFIYRLGGKSNIQINQGGVNLDFETFNGNVYLRTI